MKQYLVFLLSTILLITNTAYAGDPAIIGKHDHRIVTEYYSPNTVYKIYTKIGKATLIQFEEGETLNSKNDALLALGDDGAWAIGSKKNNLTFKPTQDLPDTNILLVTNKRTYAFDLINRNRRKTTTYIMRFIYPKAVTNKNVAIVKTPLQLKEEAEIERVNSLSSNTTFIANTEYVYRGDYPLLAPTAAWDDGRFTYLRYDHAGELPIFFKVLPDNTEAEVNYSIDEEDKSIVIIHDLIRVAKARLNGAVVEIVNKNYLVPKVNHKGTSSNNIRLEK